MKPLHLQDIQKVVDDPEWQELRKSFVGTWKTSADANLKKLRDYLGDMNDPVRLRRVLNYLTGTGFRTGKIQSPAIHRLLAVVRKSWEEKK